MTFEVMNFCLSSWMETSSGTSFTNTAKIAMATKTTYCQITKPHTTFSPLKLEVDAVNKICLRERNQPTGKRKGSLTSVRVAEVFDWYMPTFGGNRRYAQVACAPYGM